MATPQLKGGNDLQAPEEKTALTHQHSDEERQQEVTADLDATVWKPRATAAREVAEKPSGTDLARDE
ncbi:hypothetical protein ABZ918_12485 [Streptomyces viridosporus]|uniref:hypothetical protein n=1 Tax=Streptomyces viridosporus TaxID=67581 RepID=UPI003448D516